jgi:excisionase family DNA binding protein
MGLIPTLSEHRGRIWPRAGQNQHFALPVVLAIRQVFAPKAGLPLNLMADLERTQEVPSAADVAELLGMHVQMVRKYAASGRLPAYRLPGGRTLRFFRDEVLDFLKAHPVEVE